MSIFWPFDKHPGRSAVVVGVLSWFLWVALHYIHAIGNGGAGYIAKTICSARFVSHRTDDLIHQELPEWSEWFDVIVHLEGNPSPTTVTMDKNGKPVSLYSNEMLAKWNKSASISTYGLLFFRRTAFFRPGYGCALARMHESLLHEACVVYVYILSYYILCLLKYTILRINIYLHTYLCFTNK